jgi:hypothetical protein
MNKNPYRSIPVKDLEKMSTKELEMLLGEPGGRQEKEAPIPSNETNAHQGMPGSIPVEDLEKMSDKELEALLGRPASGEERLTTEEGLQAHDPRLLDRLMQLGQGAAHGAYETANFLSHVIPPNPIDLLFPEDKARRDEHLSRYEQKYEQNRQAADPFGRILMNAGSFAGGTAIPLPLAGVANAAKQGYKALRHKTPINFAELAGKFTPKPITANSIKTAAKTGAAASGLGAISGVAQELGVNPLTADLGTIFAAPLVGSALGKAGKSLKGAFSEEARKQAAEEKYLKQIGQEFLKEPNVNPQNINVGHNLKPFENTMEAEDVGALIKDKVSDKLEELGKIRSEKTDPLYKAARESPDLLMPQNFLSYINNEMPHLAGKLREALAKYKNVVEDELGGASASKAHEIILNENASPELVELIKKIKPASKSKGLPVSFLDSVAKDIGDDIASAAQKGKRTKKRILTEAQKKLNEDLLTHPLEKKRSDVYKEYSTDINKIEKSILGRLVKTKDAYGIEDVIKDDDVLKKFMSGEGSRDAARLLKETIGDDKRLNKAITEGINADFLKHVKDKDDLYSPSAIHNYIKKNAGAEILYPGFKQKAKKLAEAQQLSNDLRKLYTSSDFLKNDAAATLSGHLFKKFARNIPLGDKIWDLVASKNEENKRKTIAKLSESILSNIQQAEAAFKKTPKSKPKSTILPQFGKYSKGAIPSLQKEKDSDSKK